MDRPAAHVPVLRDEVVKLLSPSSGDIILDCTVGLGGHSESLLQAAGGNATLIGIDLDESNLRAAKERLSAFAPCVRLFHANFSQVREVLAETGHQTVNLLLADLGISSSQLDDPLRGLSFQADGPLDMRLDISQDCTAADIISNFSEAELADIIYNYGEERYSRRIARAIVLARRTERIETTKQLSDIVTRCLPAVVGKTRRGVHPATRTFQALRIAVNREFENLEQLLAVLPDVLSPGGRAGIISFHSLEDRRVKRAFADFVGTGKAKFVTRKPVTASQEEVALNPRSRSAKLRVIEKVS